MFSTKNKSGAAPSNRQIDTVIAQHCTLEGDLNSENSIKVDGLIHGTLRCQGSAIIGETGLVQGDVYSVDLLVIGKLEGNVYAENLHLHATASISGDISARTLQVDPGAHFSGTVTMRDEAAIAAEHRLAHEFREPAPIAATEHPPLESPLESPLVLVETQPDLHTITLPLEEQKPGKKRA